MNHHQWSQRLRGHINLKLCMGLGAIALAGAFVVNLPAQDKTASPLTEERSGTNPQPLVGFGITDGTTDEIKKARLDNSTRKTAKSLVPKGVTLTGTITGPFARTNSVQFEQQTIQFSEADQYLFNAKAIYNIAIELKSQQHNVFGVALRPDPSTDKNDTKTPLSVTTDVGVQNLGLEGAAMGSFLARNGVSWVVATQSPSTTSTYSGKTVVKDGVQSQGEITGLFVNFANDKIERLTHDITDTTGLGPTGSGYQVDVEMKHSSPVLQGAILENADRKIPLLSVVSDTPVKTFHLRSILDGTRFGDSGISWGAITTDDVKRAGLLSQSSIQKPQFIPLSYTADAEFPMPRSLLFVPEEHNSLITPVGFILDQLKKLGDLLFKGTTSKYEGEYASGSTSSEVDVKVAKPHEEDSGPEYACKSSVFATIGATPGHGYDVHAETDNAQAGISVLDDWKKNFSPISVPVESSKAHEVAKGKKDVKIRWKRYESRSDSSVTINYSTTSTKAFSKSVTYSVVVYYFTETEYVQELTGEPCTAEDDISYATPAPQNPPTTGGTTPVAPPPVAQP